MPKQSFKAVASFIVLVFAAQQVGFAAPVATNVSAPTVAVESISIPAFPTSVARIDDAYSAPNTSKTIYLLQDAHTNESGQFNLAKAVDHILHNEPVKYVFAEGGQGDNSLSFIKKYSDAATLEQVGKEFVQKGLLQGSEYLSLTGEKDFVLWGVENRALYIESVQSYRKIHDARRNASSYLRRVERTMDFVKSQVYGSDLLSFDQAYRQREKEKNSPVEYMEALVRAASAAGVDVSVHPHLARVKELQVKEGNIDFEKAGTEQESAIAGLTEEDRAALEAVNAASAVEATEDSQEEVSARVYYALLQEKVEAAYGSEVQTKFPELSKYFAYLKESEGLSVDGFLDEQVVVEKEVFAKLARTQDEKLVHRFSRSLDALNRLFEIQMTPDEYFDLLANPEAFDIKNITGFLNRKIVDLQDGYDKALLLDESYDKSFEDAKAFYDLAFKRDEVFIAGALAKMDESSTDKAVLVTGGFHTVNLREILKQLGISYVSVAPEVTDATNHARYEQILLSADRTKDESLYASSTTVPMTGKDTLATLLGLSFGFGDDEEKSPVYSFVEAAVAADRAVVEEEITRRIDNNINGGSGIGTSAGNTTGGRPPVVVPIWASYREPIDEDQISMLNSDDLRRLVATIGLRLNKDTVTAAVATGSPLAPRFLNVRRDQKALYYALSGARIAGENAENSISMDEIAALARSTTLGSRLADPSAPLAVDRNIAANEVAQQSVFEWSDKDMALAQILASQLDKYEIGNIVFYLDGINDDMLAALVNAQSFINGRKGHLSVAVMNGEDTVQKAKLELALQMELTAKPSEAYRVTTHVLPSNGSEGYRLPATEHHYVNIYESFTTVDGRASVADVPRHILMAALFGQYGDQRLKADSRERDNIEFNRQAVNMLSALLRIRKQAEFYRYVASATQPGVVEQTLLERSKVARFTVKLLLERLVDYIRSINFTGISA